MYNNINSLFVVVLDTYYYIFYLTILIISSIIFYISFKLITDYKDYIVDKLLMNYYRKMIIVINYLGYRSFKLILRYIFKKVYIFSIRVFYTFSISYVAMNYYTAWYHVTIRFTYDLLYWEKIFLYLFTAELACFQIIYLTIIFLIFKILSFLGDCLKPHHYDFIKKNIIKDEKQVSKILYNIDSNFIFALAVFLGCFSFSIGCISFMKLTSDFVITIPNISQYFL